MKLFKINMFLVEKKAKVIIINFVIYRNEDYRYII